MTVAPDAWTVGQAMLCDPTVHPADLTVGQARAAFDASSKRHMLLLACGGELVSTIIRTDLTAGIDPEAVAVDVGSLVGRTIAPETLLTPTHATMRRLEIRRLAVIDDSMNLLGLLCLKRSRAGFCTDDGVAAMRRARAGPWR